MRAWWLLASFMALAAAPALAQDVPLPTDVSDLVRDSTVDLRSPLDLKRLEDDPVVANACGVEAADATMQTVIDATQIVPTPGDFDRNRTNAFRAANTLVDPAGGNITFNEDYQQSGCGRVTGTYTAPVGASLVRVVFDVDRVVEKRPLDNYTAINFVEQFTYSYFQHDPQVTNLFSTENDDLSRTFQGEYALSGDSEFTLEWFFADKGVQAQVEPPAGPPIGGLGANTRCSTAITNITIEYPKVPVGAVTSKTGTREVDGQQESSYAIDIDLTPSLLGTGAAIITLQLAPGSVLESIDSPLDNTTVPAELYTVTLQGGQSGPTTVVLGKGQVIDPGNYRFHVKTLRPLPPVVVSDPPEVAWLLAAALPIPAVAGLFSTRASVLAWRNTSGPFQRSARGVLALVAFLAVVYLGTIALLLVLGRPAMTIIPLSAPAVAGYGLLALLFLGFLLLLQRANVVAARDAAAQRRVQAEALKRSNEELEQFAYVASHDLQEPLRTVANFSTLLQRRYSGKLGAEGEEFIGHTVAGAKRMQRLIQDLLAYSRIGQEVRALAPVALGQVAAQAIGDLHATIQTTKARIEVADLPVVQGEGTQLEQLFTNLIGNALKYRDPARAPVVRISAQRRAQEWILSVADNGIGIAPEHRTRIFQVFQRLHGRDVEGTGIGLAICQKIVQRHGGRIWVESEPGKGSTFRFTLPAQPR